MAKPQTDHPPVADPAGPRPPAEAHSNIAIVIAAFSRPHSLQRLLDSISRADFEGFSGIPLIISIDRGGGEDVLRCARAYPWAHGEKTLIEHGENLGLKRHILSCGGLAERFGSVIVLEDDLFVSPQFYRYAAEALDFFRHDADIAGISLYAHDYNELAQLPFRPLEDGSDNYFMRVPSSWGQLWTAAQWREFLRFYESGESALSPSDRISDIIISRWPEASWKKFFYKYLQLKDKYFVYPRVSLTTNFGDAGTSFASASDSYQASPVLARKALSFRRLGNSLARYDAYFEISPETVKAFNPELRDYDFDCDFYGTRELHKTGRKHLLSAKACARPLASFGVNMMPHELNACFNIPGDYFHFGETAAFGPMSPLKSATHSYYSKIHKINVSKIQSESFNEGVAAVRASISYRLGNALLWPAKLVKRLVKMLIK